MAIASSFTTDYWRKFHPLDTTNLLNTITAAYSNVVVNPEFLKLISGT